MMSRENTIIILALSVATLLWIVNYQIQYNSNTRGADIQQIQQQTAVYRKENEVLKIELFHKEAYTTINQEARSMGFVPGQFIYLK